MLKRFFKPLSSLRLTVALLFIGLVLVFFGTLNQASEGLYSAQNRYFRSFFIWVGPAGAGWKVPVFPAGYLVGGLLLVNLVAAHTARFKLSWKKSGIFLTHIGVILLLVGQLATDLLSTESSLGLMEGETKNYSEDFHANELALIDTSDPKEDTVVAIPESSLKEKKDIQNSALPFTVRVKEYWPNALIVRPMAEGAIVPATTAGELKGLGVFPQPEAKTMDERSLPAAVVELLEGSKSLGTWLVSTRADLSDPIVVDGKTWKISFRFARYYKDFQMTLLKATHEKYVGTDIPKNFASRVRVQMAGSPEARETVIYMNNPLRYGGYTFFQYQMGADEMARQRMNGLGSSTFQVVKNPSWLTPYLACILVGLGLLVQFMIHLVGFIMKRSGKPHRTLSRPTPAGASAQ
jgi:hypothetical protein